MSSLPIRRGGLRRRLIYPCATFVTDLAAGVVAIFAVAQLDLLVGLLLLGSGLFLIWVFGLYRERPSLRVLDDFPRIAVALVLAVAIPEIVALNGARVRFAAGDESTVGSLQQAAEHSLAQARLLLLAVVCWVGLELVARVFAYHQVHWLRVRQRLSQNTIIVGLYHPTRQLAGVLAEQPWYGLNPVGFIAADPESAPDDLEFPLLGGLGDIARAVELTNASNVIVGETTALPIEVIAAVRECDRLDAEVFLIPAMHDLVRGAVTDRIWSVPIIRMPRRAFRSVQWLVKRSLDRLVGFVLFVLALPIMAVAAFFVTRETGGGVLFRQQRVGLDGRTFDVLKLQTMVPVNAADSAQTWNIAQSDRLGPVGKFLRKTSIDELPQLWNVVRGDMSLVGPRPERPHFVEQFQAQFPLYLARHRVPCGVTGYAQILGLRGDTSIEDRVAFDNYYIESWSLWLDLKILLRTIPAVLRGAGG